MILLYIWLVLGFIGFAYLIEYEIKVERKKNSKKMLASEILILGILCIALGGITFIIAVKDILE